MDDDQYTKARRAYLCDKFKLSSLQIEPAYNRAANIQQSAQEFVDSTEAARERERKQYTAYGSCNYKGLLLGKLWVDVCPDK